MEKIHYKEKVWFTVDDIIIELEKLSNGIKLENDDGFIPTKKTTKEIYALIMKLKAS